MEIKAEWFARGFIESVFVVGSILFALGVDQWSENRDFSELADQSLGIFEHEIIQNRDRVADGLPYHQGIRDLLETGRAMERRIGNLMSGGRG
jgi:hypothetical protein